MSSSNFKRKSGFSIIEVVVALLLMAIIIPVFMGLFSNIFNLSVLTQKKGREIYKSQGIIENVIANPSSMTNVSTISTAPLIFYFVNTATVTVTATGKVVEDDATNFYIFIPKQTSK